MTEELSNDEYVVLPFKPHLMESPHEDYYYCIKCGEAMMNYDDTFNMYECESCGYRIIIKEE